MRFAWLLPAPLLAACGISVLGTATPVDGDAGVADGGSGGDATYTDGSTGGDGSVSPTNDGDITLDATQPCEPSACPGRRCVNNACSTFANCKDLRDQGPDGGPSAIYTFSVGDAGAFSAYCEMTLAGGGWTLIGQSGTGATNSFGWRSATGSVTNTSAPYSLDALGHGLAPTHVLLATGTRAAIDAAYVVTVPNGFPTGFETSAASTTVTRIQNPSCPTTDQPDMMTNMGRTALTGQFFFRDGTGNFGTGLLPANWDLYHSDNCSETGKYHGKPGMLFAR